MDGQESITQTFIIRIWLEETIEEAGRASWRGHITHVPSGTRRYFEDLDGIARFIIPYLEALGVHFKRRLGDGLPKRCIRTRRKPR